MNLALAALHVEQPDRTRRPRAMAVDAAIVCSAAAALAHVVAAPDHFTWWPASGVFFLALGAVQLVGAALLLRGANAPWFVLTCIWGTVGVILLYVASRTVGLPMTPPVPFHGGRWVVGRSIVPDGAKHVGALDMFTLVTEIMLVVLMLSMLPTRLKAQAVNRLMWVGLALWAGAVFTVLK